MTDLDTAPGTEALQDELEQFRKEKEQIKRLVGQIGGATTTTRDTAFNVVFIALIAGLFVVDVLRHVLHLDVPLPPLFSLELGVLLVSLKIIWMIHKQTKVEHFQFWILNSIEYRLNELGKRIRSIEDLLNRPEGAKDV
jgi:xanthosine utilization system XapX-like protein